MRWLRRMVIVIGMILLGALPLLAEEAAGRAESEAQAAEIRRQIREAERQLQESARRIAELQEQLGRSAAPGAGHGTAFAWVGGRPAIGVVVKMDPEGPARGGAILEAITPGGPADEAGLKPGDVITKFGGEVLATRQAGRGASDEMAAARLVELAHRMESGKAIAVEYLRGAERRTATLTARPLGIRSYKVNVLPKLRFLEPPEAPEAAELEELDELPAEVFGVGSLLTGPLPRRWLDVELVALNADLAPYFDAERGVLVVSTPKDEALRIRGGDVIVKIGDVEPVTPLQAVRTIRGFEAGAPIPLVVIRHGNRVSITATAPETEPPHARAPRAPRPPRPPRAPAPAPRDPPKPPPPEGR